MCERFNSTLMDMLGTLQPDQKADWKVYVPSVVHAYNCTRHESTGHSPFFLMYGRHPRLPVDILLGAEEYSQGQSYDKFVSELKHRLDFAYQLASTKAAESHQTQKARYDQRKRGNPVEPGDRVLIRNLGLKGRQKLADRWKQEVYTVVAQPNQDIPVFEVLREDGKGKTKVLHRNLLLPISSIPPAPPEPKDKIQRIARAAVHDRSDSISSTTTSGTDSEEEDIIFTQPRTIPAHRQSNSRATVTDQAPEISAVLEVPVESTSANDGYLSSTMSDREDDMDPEPGEIQATMDSSEGIKSDSSVQTSGEEEEAIEVDISSASEPEDVADRLHPGGPSVRRSGRTRRKPDHYDPMVYELQQRVTLLQSIINFIIPSSHPVHHV